MPQNNDKLLTKLNQSGIAHLMLIVAVVATTAVVGVGIGVSKSRQANSSQKSSTSQTSKNTLNSDAKKQQELKAAEKAAEVKKAATEAAKSASDSTKKTSPSTSTSTKPTTSTSAPKTWNIVHPSAATCEQYGGYNASFTVWGSVADGAPIYNYYHRSAAVLGKLGYKESKLVRCENTGFGPYNPYGGPTGEWLEYGENGVDGGEKYININDVSVTSPY